MISFNDLSILSWNIRGVVNKEGKRQTRVLIKRYKPLLVVLMETHCQFSRVKNFWCNLGYEDCAISEARGHSGGIWILKSQNCTYDIEIIDSYFQSITIALEKDRVIWYLSAIYASPQVTNRDQLWSYLICLRPHLNGPWLLMGDFNEILLPSEVCGGEYSLTGATKFADMVEKCRLLDLGATGSSFTREKQDTKGYLRD